MSLWLKRGEMASKMNVSALSRQITTQKNGRLSKPTEQCVRCYIEVGMVPIAARPVVLYCILNILLLFPAHWHLTRRQASIIARAELECNEPGCPLKILLIMLTVCIQISK
jgi:hypothetical protein